VLINVTAVKFDFCESVEGLMSLYQLYGRKTL